MFKICSTLFKSVSISLTGKIHLLYLFLFFTMFRLAVTTEDEMFSGFGSLQTQDVRVPLTEETRSSQWVWWKLWLVCRFFPHKWIKALSSAAGRATGDSGKSQTSRKDRYKGNPNRSSSQWFGCRLAGFQGADGASNILLFVRELLKALQSQGSVELVKMAVLPLQKVGWVVVAAELHLERNSCHSLHELVLTCCS